MYNKYKNIYIYKNIYNTYIHIYTHAPKLQQPPGMRGGVNY